MTAQPAARRAEPLYTHDILALAIALADYPLSDDLPYRGEAASRVCGSRAAIGARVHDGRIAEIGARITACAIGQAAAALFLRAAAGKGASDLHAAHDEIAAWLAGSTMSPAWAGLAILAPARAHPARHQAILLPWKAALAALSNGTPGA